MDNPLIVLVKVVQLLEQRGIKYVLVGSVASSMHGMYRTTADIDFIADIKPARIEPLLEALQDHFYVDGKAMADAIDQQRSFNAIHFDTVFKIDIFIPRPGDFSMQQLERRELKTLTGDVKQQVYVSTVEDMILAKLRWFRAGGGISETQWRDVLGMIGASSSELELGYLRQWAQKLGLSDLLDKALADAS
jgi:hypothetical protein